MKLIVKAVLHPKLFLIGISEDQSIIMHISAADFDADHGKNAAQKMLVDPKVKIERFECLTFNNHLDWGASDNNHDFSVNGYFLCHLMISIAANRSDRTAKDPDLKALFDRQTDFYDAMDWFDEVGQHVINGTMPPADRPDLLGKLSLALAKNPHLMTLYVSRGGKS